jgi:hypothetical protein
MKTSYNHQEESKAAQKAEEERRLEQARRDEAARQAEHRTSSADNHLRPASKEIQHLFDRDPNLNLGHIG